jgi:glucose-6-phosphate isomerase
MSAGEMTFDPGLAIRPTAPALGFLYGPGIFGPQPEFRRLDPIRASLLDPRCDGPDPAYAIAMDVGKEQHRSLLEQQHLLFGVVTFAAGQFGKEPVRSQGHVHRVSLRCGSSTPEVVEIWAGKALIYMQERVADDPGQCFAISAGEGDIVVVPPDWAHAVISADPACPLTFGAWCTRDYGFEYSQIRARQGLAWYPILDNGDLSWRTNHHYQPRPLAFRDARSHPEMGLMLQRPIYAEFERSPDKFQWVSAPGSLARLWQRYAP